MDVKKIFAAPKVMAVIGDVNSGKTMTFIYLIEIIKSHTNFRIFCYGLESQFDYTHQIYSLNDIEQIHNSVIFIDDIITLFDLNTRSKKKSIEKTLDLLNYQKNILILSALPENMKKFFCEKIDYFFFKKCSIRHFVNGSLAKRYIQKYTGHEKGSLILNLQIDEMLFFDGLKYEKIHINQSPQPDNVDRQIESTPPSSIPETKPTRNSKELIESIKKSNSNPALKNEPIKKITTHPASLKQSSLKPFPNIKVLNGISEDFHIKKTRQSDNIGAMQKFSFDIEGDIHRRRHENFIQIGIYNPNKFPVTIEKCDIDFVKLYAEFPMEIPGLFLKKIPATMDASKFIENQVDIFARCLVFNQIEKDEYNVKITIRTTGAMTSEFDDDFDI